MTNIYNLLFQRMNRNQLYRQTLKFATDLGFDLAPLRSSYRYTNTDFLRTKIKVYKRNLDNRNNNYTRALKISRENMQPLRDNQTRFGSSNVYWEKEVRRLRQRVKRRKPSVIQNIFNQRNILKPIVQAKSEKIEKKKNIIKTNSFKI